MHRQIVVLVIIEEQPTPTVRHALADTNALQQITEFQLSVQQAHIQMKQSPLARIAQQITSQLLAKNTAPQSPQDSKVLHKGPSLFVRTRLTQIGVTRVARYVPMGFYAQDKLGMALCKSSVVLLALTALLACKLSALPVLTVSKREAKARQILAPIAHLDTIVFQAQSTSYLLLAQSVLIALEVLVSQ